MLSILRLQKRCTRKFASKKFHSRKVFFVDQNILSNFFEKNTISISIYSYVHPTLTTWWHTIPYVLNPHFHHSNQTHLLDPFPSSFSCYLTLGLRFFSAFYSFLMLRINFTRLRHIDIKNVSLLKIGEVWRSILKEKHFPKAIFDQFHSSIAVWNMKTCLLHREIQLECIETHNYFSIACYHGLWLHILWKVHSFMWQVVGSWKYNSNCICISDIKYMQNLLVHPINTID